MEEKLIMIGYQGNHHIVTSLIRFSSVCANFFFFFVIMSSGQKSPNLLSLIILKFYLCMSNNLLAILYFIEHSQPDSGQISFQNFEILSPKGKKKELMKS